MSDLVVKHEFTPDQLALIKSTVAKGATDNELSLFLYRCQHMGLDPLKPGMVHFIKYGNAPGTVVVGIDGFRAKAQSTGKFAGISRGVIRDDKGKCIGAWCEVRRSDWQAPAREEVSLAEYSTGKAMWAKMPETMIKKVAEVAALRMAFPDDLGGVYSDDEMDQAGPRDARQPAQGQIVQLASVDLEIEVDPIDEALNPKDAEPALADYKVEISPFKGKCLGEIPTKDISKMLGWVDQKRSENNDFRPHPKVTEFYEKATNYLIELSERK